MRAVGIGPKPCFGSFFVSCNLMNVCGIYRPLWQPKFNDVQFNGLDLGYPYAILDKIIY